MAAPAGLPWSSPHTGWHSESRPFTGSFTPTREALIFVQLFNAPARHNGFNVAFFKPDIAVDKMGRILCVPSERFESIALLARQTFELPETGSFGNTWRIKHMRSDRDIRRLLVAPENEDERSLKESSVYGYEKGREELQEEVHGIKILPGVLMELFGLLEEAVEGYRRGKEDSSVIEAIKALL